VLLPEPEPVDGAVGLVGLVVLPELDEPELPPMLEEPLPALPLRASRWHLSSAAPLRPVHLVASPLDDPEAAPDAPEVELSLLPAAGAVVLLPEEDELPVEGVAEGAVVLLPDEPAPVLPLLEPEDWANAAPDSARSAAAVAAVSVFNIMREISFEGWMNAAGVKHARVMPLARGNFFRAPGMPPFVQAASCASPRP